VVLCDPRILSKSYGREMLAALPGARRLTGPWRTLLPELERFYREEPAA
jgi:ATP-dependent DNA helicase DinG